jgi:hypothetical protein
MEENLIENEDNAMNKGLPNLLIRKKLNRNLIPSYINKPYVIICWDFIMYVDFSLWSWYI